ncbi:MAG: hypothetical protein IKP72_03730, partial [Clostridia bacterium]|nr:hypothetical protein [Clostridia bacterium]
RAAPIHLQKLAPIRQACHAWGHACTHTPRAPRPQRLRSLAKRKVLRGAGASGWRSVTRNFVSFLQFFLNFIHPEGALARVCAHAHGLMNKEKTAPGTFIS